MKAFDTVPHQRLLRKLESYGITDPLLSWISDFLNNRVQRVIVNGTPSPWSKVLSGIPQGSVLGPLLFIIFINDICESLSSSAYLFADDTKLFRIIKEDKDTELLQSDIDTIMKWSDKWLLRFNKEKCKLLSVNGSISRNYYINTSDASYKLDIVSSEKDIGVTFDSSLEFDQHISEKINKANSLCAMIRRSYKFLNCKMFLPSYKALVRSHLEYGNSVWSPYKMKYIDAIERVQRRATKMLPGMDQLTYEERLRKLKLPTLVYRRMRGDMIEVFKILHELYDVKAAPILSLRNVESTRVLRGHHLTLVKCRSNRKLRSESFTQRVVLSWNSLPSNVVSAPSLNSFKNRLDKFWSNQDIMYNYKSKLHYSSRPNTEYDKDTRSELTIEV